MHRAAEPSSADSERLFRGIFAAHLESEGRSEEEIQRLIFKTPAAFHSTPQPSEGLELVDAFRRSYERQLACAWFFEGLEPTSNPEPRWLDAPERPVTLVVVPGIFGEFIEHVPFHSVVDRANSRFRRKWQSVLDETEDEVFSLLELEPVPCKLADAIRIGSLDQGARSFANVVVLRPEGGSLETLGTLGMNAEVFRRRLTSFFEAISDDTDIYLVGYSRGLAVALELVSELHGQAETGAIPDATRAWFERVRGVVGLGGVYYGANFAHEVLAGESGATSDLLRLLVDTSDALETVADDATVKQKAEGLARNAKTWAKFVKSISDAEAPTVAEGKEFLRARLDELVSEEGKARILGRDIPLLNPWGIFALVNAFFLKTFRLGEFVSRYNENIRAFKLLVDSVVVGVNTLTPASRDEWWRTHELPEDLALFSITGTMPDAYFQGLESPLWSFEGFGVKTADYNVSLRASYYDTVGAENTLINDSQVSHFCSRYWSEMYPQHQYEHHYLGVLGTHHWGMAFPYAIEDYRRTGPNPFPRALMLQSIAAYIGAVKDGSSQRPG